MSVKISPQNHSQRKRELRSPAFLVRHVLITCGSPQMANMVLPNHPIASFISINSIGESALIYIRLEVF